MKVKVEKSGPCRKILRVELPADAAEREVAEVTDAYARLARLPGYRQGHAPRALVERRHAREIEEAAKEQLVAQSYEEALRQASLNPLALLRLESRLVRGEPFRYEVTLDVAPEFKLPKYKGVGLKMRPVTVSDADVQQAVEAWLDRLATYVPVAGRPAGPGDLVQIDYEAQADGRPLAALGRQAAGLARGAGLWLLVGERAFVPGLEAALPGLAPGDEREVPVTFPADFKVPSLAGRAAVYRLRVKAVRAKQRPALDADLLQKAGADSPEAFRAKVRAALEQQARRQERDRQKEDLIRHLLAKTTLELPETLVQEEARTQFVSLVRRRLMGGASREQVEEQRADLLSAATRTAGDKVKLGYLLHRIAEEEQIAVSDADLDQAIQALAAHGGQEPAALREELEKRKDLDALRHQVRMDKTLDALLDQARPAEDGFFSRLVGRS